MVKKKIIITGGNSGIGLELTKKLLSENHQIGLVLKNQNRKNDLQKVVETKNIDFFYGDLSKQSEVVKVGNEIIDKWGSLDILYNNAGVLLDQVYLSEKGNEMHFEVNTLAPLILSRTLRERTDKNSKLVIINSVTDYLHRQKKIISETLLSPKKNKKLFGAYLQSKLSLVLLMNDWAKNDKNLHILSIAPGPTKTKMTSGSGMPLWALPLRHLFFSKPSTAATYLFKAGFSEEFLNKENIFIQKNTIHNFLFELDRHTKEKLLKRIKVQISFDV